jgi:hypothetical protein
MGTATAVNTTSQATNKPRLISEVILMIKRQQELQLVRGAALGPQRTDARPVDGAHYLGQPAASNSRFI